MKKISLCLSGGGIKGAAHIGVLKALEENNYKIEYISGTSSGSIVATLYAAGFSADEIYKIFKKYCKSIKYVDINNIFKLIFGLIFTRKIVIDGLNSGKIIEKLINKMCDKKNIYNISDIKMPLVVPSVNMKNGEVICFTSKEIKNNKNLKYTRNGYSDKIIFCDNASIGKVVRASCSYPVIFSPTEFENMQLIDGGIRENIPWKELKYLGAENILSVIFETEKDENCCNNFIEVAGRSIDLLCRELSQYEINGADNILKIKTEKINLLDINKMDKLFEIGYIKGKEFLDNIKF